MNRQCTFNGCGKKHVAKGLCHGHYKQQRLGQELRPLQQKGRVRCEASDGLDWSCIRPHYANDLCRGHWEQSKTGKPFTPIRVVTDATARSVMHAVDFQPSTPFPGSKKPWPGVCLKCGQPCSPRYNHVQKGGGACPSCAEHGFKPAKPAVFYVVTGRGWIKGGITNVPDIRLRQHARQGLDQVLHALEFESGYDALALEDLWLEQLAKVPALARPTKTDLPDGWTEACRDVPMVRRWIDQHLVTLTA